MAHLKCHLWWCKPLIPPLGKERPAGLYESEISLVYMVSSTIARGYIDRLSQKSKWSPTQKATSSLTGDQRGRECGWPKPSLPITFL